MRKASRLFEIIQLLRVAPGPVTAAQMADSLGVTSRSIYRDVAALQAMHVPVEGGRGIGYILRSGFELPPLMFSIEETEAIVLALALLERTGDTSLREAARRVDRKIAGAMPPPLRKALRTDALYAWGSVMPSPAGVDLAIVRGAIRDEQKLAIDYRDEAGRKTHRIVQPLALIYYSDTINVVAWCELREAIRRFRADRVESSTLLDAFFQGEGDALRKRWVASWGSDEAAPAIAF